MTQNLRLQNKTISAADSNLPSGKTVAIPASGGAWCKISAASCTDKLLTQSSGNSTYGVYYNWYTATATYGTFSMTSGSVSYDICPKGWRIPTGGSSGNFNSLHAQYPSLALMTNTVFGPGFSLAGFHNADGTQRQGYYASYHSGTVKSQGTMYILYMMQGGSPDVVSDSASNALWYGFPVRCVAK